jgi:hypothetical protein
VTSSVVIGLALELLRRAVEFVVADRPVLADPLPFFLVVDAFLVVDDILNLSRIMIILH